MGIDNNFLRLLGEAARSDVNLEKTARFKGGQVRFRLEML
jgi:hypothetical protein